MFERGINISLLSISIIISIIILLYQLIDKNDNNIKGRRWFSGIVISNIVMLAGDLCDRSLGGKQYPWAHMTITILSIILYYAATASLLTTTLGWLQTNVIQRKQPSKIWIRVSVTLTICETILAIIAPMYKIVYVDRFNYYRRGELFLLMTIIPYILYILCVVFLIKYIKLFKKSELIALGGFIAIPMVSNIIQIVNNKLLIMNVVISLGLIVVNSFIQHQREMDKEQQMNELVLLKNEKLEDMRERQERLNYELIDVLCGAVEAKDIYTRGHSLRVAQYAREIMYRLGGDEEAQEEVYCIGILHDVGKISVKDEIINKKGRLTDEEYDQIKLHTIAGYQILKGVDLIPDLAVGARWHHERYDGTGYPNGLSGENIPLIARIISVADAYDAMTSNRSYHSVMPQSEVREQIVKGMGTQFDPKIAQIMLDMIDEDMQYNMKQVNYNRVINILVIDDDPFIHNMIEQLLVDENYSFTFASSGEEGIEIMKNNKFQLCLLDKEMPGMNGFEVLQWIRDHIRKLKVILLTGDKDIETIKRAEELGADDYISKPINVRVVKESIKGVLSH